MIKNLTTNQILLIAMATMLLLLAAFSFYLLQDISAPLPFAPPSPSSTVTPLPPTSTHTPEVTSTSTPTRQTSYTPFASPGTTSPQTPSEVPITSETVIPSPGVTSSPSSPNNTSTVTPLSNATQTLTPTPSTATNSPIPSQTLVSGEFGVDGRIVQNSTPVANVKVEFVDDAASRQDTTDPGGHYWFTTLAPGTNFTLTFNHASNPQLTPVAEIASFAWIEGTLPSGVDTIQLPDLEVSLNIDGMIFDLQTPTDGSTYSAAAISSSNPIQFNWSLYNQGESYYAELGEAGSDEPLWISNEATLTTLMWDGTLADQTHITQGDYWWRVAATKSLGDFTLIVFTQEWDITFNP